LSKLPKKKKIEIELSLSGIYSDRAVRMRGGEIAIEFTLPFNSILNPLNINIYNLCSSFSASRNIPEQSFGHHRLGDFA
jgi:hypothetical protein